MNTTAVMTTPAELQINAAANYSVAFGLTIFSIIVYVYFWNRLVIMNDSLEDHWYTIYTAALTIFMAIDFFLAIFIATNNYSIFYTVEVTAFYTSLFYALLLYLVEEVGLMILRNSLDDPLPSYSKFKLKTLQTYQRRMESMLP